MHRIDIGMAQAGRNAGQPQDAPPGAFLGISGASLDLPSSGH
jgi:hypothetical protein